MNSEEKPKLCWLHKYIQVKRDGVYSIEKERSVRETPFALLVETFNVLEFQCVKCGHVKHVKTLSFRRWLLKGASR